MREQTKSAMVYHLEKAIAAAGEQALPQVKPYRFPLVELSYGTEEIMAACQVLFSGQLTMGPLVEAFEKQFAEYAGSKYAVMVNSGSSANLLAVAAYCDPDSPVQLKRGDRVAMPAVAWSTSIWPWVQFGIEPVFVDVDPKTLNLDQAALERAYKVKPFKAIQLVHTLGNGCEMGELLAFAKKHGLLVFEDTCEALGSTYKSRVLGTLGVVGTYSFYFSHHITTIEGGMVVTNNARLYDILRTQRAHGWARQHSKYKKYIRDNPDVDPRFLFISTGFNLRPMEIQAAFGQCQLRKLDGMNENRIKNVEALKARLGELRASLPAKDQWKLDLTFPMPT
ncbi:MAG: DegT/DnrJ/EryC1/StrS family aminotransferase, partial [Limisphaerales bacterium]